MIYYVTITLQLDVLDSSHNVVRTS